MSTTTTIIAEVLQIGVPNRNGRTYPVEAAQAMIEQANKRIAEGTLLGELGEVEGTSVSLDNVSHIVRGLRLEGDTVVATLELMKTPKGEILSALLAAETGPVFRTRGTGLVDEHGVISQYQLISIDAVMDGA
jgi:hypothetical protein